MRRIPLAVGERAQYTYPRKQYVYKWYEVFCFNTRSYGHIGNLSESQPIPYATFLSISSVCCPFHGSADCASIVVGDSTVQTYHIRVAPFLLLLSFSYLPLQRHSFRLNMVSHMFISSDMQAFCLLWLMSHYALGFSTDVLGFTSSIASQLESPRDGISRTFPTYVLSYSAQGVRPSQGAQDPGTAPVLSSSTSETLDSSAAESLPLSSTLTLTSSDLQSTTISTIHTSALGVSPKTYGNIPISTSISSSTRSSSPTLSHPASFSFHPSSQPALSPSKSVSMVTESTSSGQLPSTGPIVASSSAVDVSQTDQISTPLSQDTATFQVHLPLVISTKIMANGATSMVMVTGTPPLITPSPGTAPMADDWKKIETPIAAEIDSITYMLPIHGTKKVKHINNDNKLQVMELSFGEIKIFTEGDKSPVVWKIPSDLSGTGILIQPSSGTGSAIRALRGSRSLKKHKSLLDAFKDLTRSASDAVKAVNSVTDSATKFIDSGFKDADEVFSSMTATIQEVTGILEDTSGMASDFGIELSQLSTSGVGNMPAAGAKVFDAYESASGIIDLLRPLEKITRSLRGSPGFNGPGTDVAKLLFGNVFTKGGATGVVSLTVTSGALLPLAIIEYDENGPISGSLPSLEASPSSTSQIEDSKPKKQYSISTQDGTSLATYRAFLATLPDTIVYSYDQTTWPHVNRQLLGIKLTDEQAKVVRNVPIVRSCFERQPSRRMMLSENFNRYAAPELKIPTFDSRRLRRDGASPVDRNVRFITRKYAPDHLQLLSQAKKGEPKKPGYLYHEKLGQGATVYIFDSGFDPDHPELAQGERLEKPQFWVVPNHLALSNAPGKNPSKWAPEDLTDYYGTNPGGPNGMEGVRAGYIGHGVSVAAAAVGIENGVAPKANLIGIKIVNAQQMTVPPGDPNFPPGEHYCGQNLEWHALEYALDKAIEDVILNNRQGKAVFNFSWFFPAVAGVQNTRQVEIDAFNALFDAMKKPLDDLGILVTIAAGNDADSDEVSLQKINTMIPSNLETEDSAYLVVGGVDNEGRVLNWASVADYRSRDPQIRIYAQASELMLGWSGREFDGTPMGGYTFMDGTSYSAPMIAGLGAYFMSLDTDCEEVRNDRSSPGGLTGSKWKKYIIRHGHELYPGNEYMNGKPYFTQDYYSEIKVGYNRAPLRICSAIHGP
ncbi:hypothetical protein EJ05DRAFT_61384 [Pseudovirgaria hyperparasitica]|uniref:Peptidase S8/S53 domain-containing protein n=1 Tax=Pseudovirgaria hyperparasitica TaxID=470096 RepID=A0A6A6W2T7_9PEZI|nr:uncharacterized protein EJ05DRAFT_61384 [Pseudovirgaria hyperparasitica]KAF2756306.1 hypothetical protein EJ05DRAFT_61384 [Pseudovirgaria hyperparasitica]